MATAGDMQRALRLAGCDAELAPLSQGALVPPLGVAFESRGVVLVVGDDAGVVPHALTLAQSLRVVVCAPGVETVTAWPRGVVALGGRITGIDGSLGAFRARAASGPGANADIGGFSPNADQSFDLVLDLARRSLIERAVPPLGYFAPCSEAAMAAAMAVLPALVGRFVKPRYFEYTPGLCAHGAQGKTGCTRCLDVCGAQAIRSSGDMVTVDPLLCQGCASCALACPTGALSYREFARAAGVDAIARTLAAAREAGVSWPVLVVHTERTAEAVRAAGLPLVACVLQVPAVPAFGEELWLAALAQGAGAVVLVHDDDELPVTRALLEARLDLAVSLLASVGTASGRLSATTLAGLRAVVDAASAAATTARSRTTAANPKAAKRPLLLSSLDTLATGAPLAPVMLAAGAAFGNVVVDRDRCTLCHACVNLCPTLAFVADNEPTPRLSLIEAACVQCGLCAVGCPERAIVLEPRFVPDPVARNAIRLLNEDGLAACTSCGALFIGRRLLEASIARVRHFPGLVDAGGTAMLRMCPECRQREMLGGAGFPNPPTS
jgi:ferredoxin